MKIKKYNNNFELSKVEAKNMVENWINYDYEVADLVLVVLRGIANRIAIINKSIRDENLELLKEETHSFKGVAGNFNISEIYELLVELDEYLKDYGMIDENVKVLVSQLNVIIDYIPDEYYDMIILPPKLSDDV